MQYFFHLLQSVYRGRIQSLNRVRGTSVILTIEHAIIAVIIDKQEKVDSVIMVL